MDLFKKKKGKKKQKVESPKKAIPIRKPSHPKMEKSKIRTEPIPDHDREEQMRLDRLESAMRYESQKLYKDAIKYYKMAGEEEEAERVQNLMEELYLKTAREFEEVGKFEEAANLYEILGMGSDALRCRSKSGTKIPELDLEEGDEVMGAFTNMGDSAEEEFSEPDDDFSKFEYKESPERIPAHRSEDEEEEELPVKKPKGKMKVFAFCPYCGEEFDLPKQPKFCPYCREPFS